MRIELEGWESEGLRSPDCHVDLRAHDGGVSRIALVQMPNGTGKTTTLTMLAATLSGSATRWDATYITSLRKRNSDIERGWFRAHLRVDGKQLSLELTLDFVNGTASYRTTTPGSGGIVNGWRVPPALHRFLDPEFLQLFVFDGEFADRLMNPKFAEADRAVDALCQVYLLDQISAFSLEHWERASKNLTARTETGLQKWRSQASQLERRLKEVSDARGKASGRLVELDAELDEVASLITARINQVESTRERHAEATEAEASAKRDASTASAALLGALRIPSSAHPQFAMQLNALRHSLDRLKLPENTSSQFFRELLDEEECICGRPLDQVARTAITERAGRYLDSDEAGLLNALKRDIAQYVTGADDATAGHEVVIERGGALARALRSQEEAAVIVRALKAQLVAAGDEELKTYQDDEDELRQEKQRLTDLIADIDSSGDPTRQPDQEYSTSRLRSELQIARDRIAEITRTVKLRQQADLIADVMTSAAKTARATIKRELVLKANQRLSTVLSQEPVQIERIDRSIKLAGQAGASVGQTLSVGYVFLLSILERGQNAFPLIVDSPANPIDQGVRRQIARLIPRLSSQFVGFTINTEREGFADTIVQSHPDALLLTLFRRTSASEALLQEAPEAATTTTGDSVLVRDQEFFFSFDIPGEGDQHGV